MNQPLSKSMHVVFAFAIVILLGIAACGADDPQIEPMAEDSTVESTTMSVGDVGFETPESVLHDQMDDVYLVSNIHGAPMDKNNNGFISRVSPTGEVLELRWVEGGMGEVVLHAPKGMALRGDSLFAADIDSIRIFDRQTGAPLGGWAVPGAVFLNDLAMGSDGSLYVTDSGIRFDADGMHQTGTDAVYRLSAEGGVTEVARGDGLHNPNGIFVDEDGVIVVPFGSSEVYHIDESGSMVTLATLPGGQLDGVERVGDGSLLISSWGGEAIYRVDSAGVVTTEVDGLDAPADIGYDRSRQRVLIPLFNENRVEIRTVNYSN